MTLPASGPISMSQVNTELLITPSTTLITMNDSGVRFLTGTSTGTTDSMQQLLGKSYVIAANSGILTSGSSYTLPQTSGTTIKILVIAGGGGGGGGNYRRTQRGYYVGAGGGGAGGNAYATVTVTPGQTISFSIGGAGAAGSAGYGVYSPLSTSGSAGTTTYATVSGSTVAQASAGGGGYKSDNDSFSAGGTAGSASTGSALISATAGGDASDTNTSAGGIGAKGYVITTTVGTATASILSYGSSGATYSHGVASASQPGTIYGAGGGGGGTNQSDEENASNAVAAAGTAGAVFIWWGY